MLAFTASSTRAIYALRLAAVFDENNGYSKEYSNVQAAVKVFANIEKGDDHPIPAAGDAT